MYLEIRAGGVDGGEWKRQNVGESDGSTSASELPSNGYFAYLSGLSDLGRKQSINNRSNEFTVNFAQLRLHVCCTGRCIHCISYDLRYLIQTGRAP